MKKRMSFASLTLAALLIGCGSDPDVPPRFRLNNATTSKADVQVKTSGGNTININVDPGVTSDYQESSVGKIEITANVQGDTAKYINTFDAYKNEKYTIKINANSAITIVSP